MFIYTTYVLAALSANILPALLLMWSILYGVLEEVGYKKGDKYTTLMVLGTMFGAISGQPAKPFVGSALAVVASFEKASKMQLDYLPYMIFGFILSFLAVVVFSLLIKFVFKPDMSKIANISTEQFDRDKLPPMDLRQKILFGCLFGYLVLILLPSLLPKTIGAIAFINKMGPWGVVIAFVVGLCLFKINGKPIIDFKEIAGRYVIWDVYFLIAMAMVVSAALTDSRTGINLFLTDLLNPVLGDRSPVLYGVILAVISLVLANIANHAVMGMLLMPIVYAFSMKNGANPQGMATLVTFGLHVGILLPSCSPYAAVLLANKDWVDAKEVMKYGSVVVVSILILYILVGVPAANLLF